MKIAVPLQTPKFGLDQGVSRAEEMVVNLSSIPDLKVNISTIPHRVIGDNQRPSLGLVPESDDELEI